MAATTQQGKSFTLFTVGITAAAAGVAYFSSGMGKVACVIGFLAVAVSLVQFFKIKPLEGKTGETPQPLVLKLVGIACTFLGWIIVLFGIHATASLPGRMVTTLVGFAVTLVGVLYFLPAASSKNAIWKS
jgi:hypothetical protein